MKNLLIAFVLIFFLPLTASAQTGGGSINQHRSTISVTGEAEIRVVPDEVLISMSVETRSGDLLVAKKQNDQVIKQVLAYVSSEAGVDKKHVQTDFVNVSPEYQSCSHSDRVSGQCDPLKIIYFQVSKGIQIRLNDLDRYEDIITKALEMGVTGIDNVQFITTELRLHRDKARALAAIAAREKAEAVAKTMGMKVLKPTSINLNSSNWFYWSGSQRRGHNNMMQNVIQSSPSGAGAGGSGNIALGQINVTATVNATFEIE